MAPARGELSAGLTGLVADAADLHAFGAQDTALAAVAAHDRSLTRLARRSASAEGLGAGLIVAATGLTLWGVLLLRFCDLAGGTATLGGHDLRAYRADDVRTVIGGCTQDPHIFNASIRENIRLARPAASDGELAEAARQAGLLPWIESLPLGWDTPAGPSGGAVPGGERQRLALAGPCSRGLTC